MSAHSDPYVVQWSTHVADLVQAAQADREWYESLAQTLLRPEDRVALDVGCGGGGMTLALAQTLSARDTAGRDAPDRAASGRVVAVDGEPELLAAVRDQLTARELDERVTVDLVSADLDHGVDPVRQAMDTPADLVWASAAIHHAGDQQAAVDVLAGLLAPGGRLALAEGGLPARHLPWDLGVGEPGLELRLDAAHGRWFARMRDALPGATRMPYGWTEALRRAGLADVTTRTTLRERPAPLADADRDRMLDRLAFSVDRLRPTGLLEPDDLAAWDRLLDPADSVWLGRRTDLYRLDARSVHLGTRPGAAS